MLGKKEKEILAKAEKDLADGKAIEVILLMEYFVEQGRNCLMGKEDFPDNMINFMAGRKKVPLKDKKKVKTVEELLAKAEVILEKAKKAYEDSPCEHDWNFEECGSDIMGYWIDVNCGRCKSSITIRPMGRQLQIDEWNKFTEKHGLTPENFHDKISEMKVEK